MHITNRAGLPAPIVQAILNDPYDAGDSDISVTRLIQPPQMRKLMREHGQELSEDASDRIWALLGQAVHTILERAYKGSSAIVERRIYREVAGWNVSGQFDVLEDGILSDYKITSVYARDGKREWEEQLNLLRALAATDPSLSEITKLQIVAIFRDWRPKEALKDDYPDSQVAIIPVTLWTIEKAEAFLHERVQQHQSDNPPPCTDDERWLQPEKWALMKKGAKRAIKLFEAKPDNVELQNGQFWEHRPGAYRRCESYCSVSSVCPQLLGGRGSGDHFSSPLGSGAAPAGIEGTETRRELIHETTLTI